MDVVQAVSGYVSKMVSAGENASGSASAKMKILLLDNETVGASHDILSTRSVTLIDQVSIISTAITQSTLLNHEIYLIEYDHKGSHV